MHARVLATAVHRSAAHDAQWQNLELNSHDTVPLNDRSKLKGQCTDVKSGCGTSVGPSLNPHSLSLKTFLVTLSL